MEIPSRVVIERVRPQVDDGRFPIKRVVGEAVEVTADIFADGHDQLEAVVRYRQIAGVRTGDTSWREERMSPLGNDRWSATFHVEALGRYEYTLVGWVDRFGSWQEDVRKRVAAGQAVASELLEGSAAILATASRLDASRGPKTGGQTPPPESEPEGGLRTRALAIAGSEDEARRVELALDPNLTAVMRRHSAREGAATYDRTLEVLVQRPRARFGAWYEMFPRSAGPDPQRHVRRGSPPPVGHRRHGVRCPLPASDSPHRPELPQRKQQHLGRGSGRSGQPLGDRWTGRRTQGGRARP